MEPQTCSLDGPSVAGIPDEDSSRAVHACVHAAHAWQAFCVHKAQTTTFEVLTKSSETVLDALMTAAENLQRLRPHHAPILRPLELVSSLFLPLQTLISCTEPDPLLEGNASEPQLTEYALELLEWEQQDPEALQVTQAFQSLLTRLRQAREQAPERIDDQYRHFRRYLIEHPLTNLNEATKQCRALSVSWKDFYEDIPPSCLVGLADRLIYACPGCCWPLQRRWDELYACHNRRCVDHHLALYSFEGDRFIPQRGGPELMPFRDDDMVRLKPTLWRRIVLPGLQELDLYTRIQTALPSAHLTLWPALDAYDLRVEFGAQVLKIDVKAWRRLSSLQEHLREHPPAPDVMIAIPDYQLQELPAVWARWPSTIPVKTFSQLIQQLQGMSS